MIKFLDLQKLNAPYREAFNTAFQEFLDSGQYILGSGVAAFETEFANYCQTKFCIGVGNGLDAITLIFKAYIELGVLQKGDEVIVPANTFIASILGVLQAGLKPVLVEPDIETYTISVEAIQSKISTKTKAILVVHLYGQLVDVSAVKRVVGDMLIVEDAAQAHGATAQEGKKAGSLGHAAAFSFYPGKNLGALGDGGAITTNDVELAELVKKIRNYGTASKYVNEYPGCNSRLDDIQARFLSLKLKNLDTDNDVRRKIANRYLSNIKNSKIILPLYQDFNAHVFHLFVVRVSNRADFMAYASKHGIETLIHYPIPPHKQEALHAYNALRFPITEHIHNTVVSLPISPVMEEPDVDKLIIVLNAY